MSKQPSAANTQMPLGRMSDTAAYSARIQETMRYDKRHSSDYPIVMTIMHAVSQGFTEEEWEKEQQRTVSILSTQEFYPPFHLPSFLLKSVICLGSKL